VWQYGLLLKFPTVGEDSVCAQMTPPVADKMRFRILRLQELKKKKKWIMKMNLVRIEMGTLRSGKASSITSNTSHCAVRWCKNPGVEAPVYPECQTVHFWREQFHCQSSTANNILCVTSTHTQFLIKSYLGGFFVVCFCNVLSQKQKLKIIIIMDFFSIRLSQFHILK
jgi:hypothetical protein